MNDKSFNASLFQFLNNSPTPFHCVQSLKGQLESKGFIELREDSHFAVKKRQSYFVIRDNGTIAAFQIGKDKNSGFRIIGSHSDSPSLQIKPNHNIYENKYHKLNVEVYGGPLLNPWFDRELTIAGRVYFTRRKRENQIHCKLINFKRSIAIIPSIAIHFDRNANKERAIHTQKDLMPLIGLDGESKIPFTDHLKDQIHKEHDISDIAEFLSFDLFLISPQRPVYSGIHKDIILAPRLDNLLSCFIASEALHNSSEDHNCMIVINNHEEIGSTSRAGAHGNFLSSIFERIQNDANKRHSQLAKSFFISLDNAHAVHPNQPEKSDKSHTITLNQGPVLKINANHRYTSTGPTSALFKLMCIETGIPCQEFVMRNDMPCGSTIGPMTSAKLGFPTVDIGVASLAMHSVNEVTGSKDPYLMFKVLKHFFNRSSLPLIK